jgi:multidrug efflux pump subunit AcrB
MTALNGVPITSIWEDDYAIDVVLIEDEEERDEIQDLNDQYVNSFLTMNSLPLRTVGQIKPDWTEGNIGHRNGTRTITILADVERNYIYSKVLADVKPEIDQIVLAKGQSLNYGGEREQMIENYIPMAYSLAFSLVLIFFILLFQFKTSRRALVIMSTMLLSLFGAVFGLKVVGYPFSLTAFIGVIGLMGITVRNGIILVDYAMQLVTKEGLSFKEAGIQAGKRRMRPIFLTSMAAAMGVVPMIISASPLWGPLGTVICFGLIFGMIITLYVLPVLYWKTTGKNSLPKSAQNTIK